MTGSRASGWSSSIRPLGALRLNFVDQRIFGSMAIDGLVPTPDGRPGGFAGAVAAEPLVPIAVAHIARDPLDPAFDDARFLAALARRRTGIKRALLDQTLVSGIGNIYADESLWAARIHYDQPTDLLSGPGRRRCSPRCASCSVGHSRRAARASTPST